MTKQAWIYVATGYVIMAIGFTVFAFLLHAQVHRIDRTQKQAIQTQRDLGELAIHNSGAICLVATAIDQQKQAEIVDVYLAGKHKITRLFTPKCSEVANRAARDVFDSHLPRGLDPEGGGTP